jgi:hypothetical protein
MPSRINGQPVNRLVHHLPSNVTCNYICTKRLLVVVLADRTLATAQILVHLVAQVPAPGVVPLFASDQLNRVEGRRVAPLLEYVSAQPPPNRTDELSPYPALPLSLVSNHWRDIGGSFW